MLPEEAYVPNTSANIVHIIALTTRSACDLNPMLLLGGAILGGFAAALALLGWLYLRRKRISGSSKSIRE